MTCPACSQPIGQEMEVELEKIARELAAVDRAVRVYELAARRKASPYVPPPSVSRAAWTCSVSWDPS